MYDSYTERWQLQLEVLDQLRYKQSTEVTFQWGKREKYDIRDLTPVFVKKFLYERS